MTASGLANRAWQAACRPADAAFQRALLDPDAAQERVLAAHLRATADTAIGRRYGFNQIRTLAEFQARVPLLSWNDHAADIARIEAGETGVWTRAPVRLLEPTGGTTGGTRLVPYTRPMQGQIRTAVAVWMADLFRAVPALRDGPAYWSVSPAGARCAPTAGGVPVGFDSDAALLSPLHARLARAVMAAPEALRLVERAEAHRYATLLHLVARADLALVSVWNPTFLSVLVAPLRAWSGRLARDLADGTLTSGLDAGLARRLAPRADARRAAELLTAVRDEPTDAGLHARLWPRLALVSAWADGHAAVPFRALRALFPHAAFQPKGLMATEGVVSIPLAGHDGVGHGGAALALTSHLVELVDGDRAVPLDEAHVGDLFEVALTTGGGLVRTRLGDRVRVVGHAGRCPLVRFVGRVGPVSDRVGEKLHDAHVSACLAELPLPHRFTLVACDDAAQPPAYVLFAETDASDEALRAAAVSLDAGLGTNPGYAHARRLGQLGPARAFRIRGSGAEAFLAGCVALGQRAGDVKPAALHRDGGWAGRFAGAFMDAPRRQSTPS